MKWLKWAAPCRLSSSAINSRVMACTTDRNSSYTPGLPPLRWRRSAANSGSWPRTTRGTLKSRSRCWDGSGALSCPVSRECINRRVAGVTSVKLLHCWEKDRRICLVWYSGNFGLSSATTALDIVKHSDGESPSGILQMKMMLPTFPPAAYVYISTGNVNLKDFRNWYLVLTDALSPSMAEPSNSTIIQSPALWSVSSSLSSRSETYQAVSLSAAERTSRSLNWLTGRTTWSSDWREVDAFAASDRYWEYLSRVRANPSTCSRNSFHRAVRMTGLPSIPRRRFPLSLIFSVDKRGLCNFLTLQSL